MNITCPHCKETGNYYVSEMYENNAILLCYKCFGTIVGTTEQAQANFRIENTYKRDTCLQVLKKGESVVIINEEHPWKNQIAIICGIKHKFTRIELLGKKIWVPNEWTKRYESNKPT